MTFLHRLFSPCASIWRYLLHGSDDLVLPKDWLANTPRLRAYTAYTMRQLQQGAVVSDVDAMRRKAFWEAIAAAKAQRITPANVAAFRKQGER